MEITDLGYTFRTSHSVDEDGVFRVLAKSTREQTQATILPNEPFILDFYGLGNECELFVTAVKRLEVSGTTLFSHTLKAIENRSIFLNADLLKTTSPGATAPPVVLPRMRNQFDDREDFDPIPPRFEPGPGGRGVEQSEVFVQLFHYATNQEIGKWKLPEGSFDEIRKVPRLEGMPTGDSPRRTTTWWRMVVTPIGQDPVNIALQANAPIPEVPLQTKKIPLRLTNHLFRVALDALMPQVKVMGGSRLTLSIGAEIASLFHSSPTVFAEDVSPITISDAQLQALSITSVSGDRAREIVTERLLERARKAYEAARPPSPNQAPTPNQPLTPAELEAVARDKFRTIFDRLDAVASNDVCIRIQAVFTDTTFSVWGIDLAELDGELGELILAFDQRLENLRPFALFDVDLNSVTQVLKDIANIFTEVKEANEYIEALIIPANDMICKYMKAFLGRAVAQEAYVHAFSMEAEAWKITYSVDPEIPLPGVPDRPRHQDAVGETAGGIPDLLARHQAQLGLQSGTAPGPQTKSSGMAQSSAQSTKPPAPSSAADPLLSRLDQHDSIVVVMMENRSYDHMLGDLVNKRSNGYEGVSIGTKIAGVAGFPNGVPLVLTRDLLLGTAIPVSPGHLYSDVQFQIGDGTKDGRSSGDMQGFARNIYRRTDSPQLACTVYGEDQIPVHYRLADEFTTCDYWFAAHPGPTQPNRFATMMGAIPSIDNFENDDPRIGFLKQRNIFDVLSAASIEWRVFESDISMIRMLDKYRLDAKNVVPLDDPEVGLEATLRNGKRLPRVMFVEPNFVDIPPLNSANDDHPPADLENGQEFLARICDLLWDTGNFGKVLLVITYDEHGGFYDHVPPPGTSMSGTGPVPPLIKDGPTWLGVRVPTFVISPYVDSGSVSKTVFDHTSILKTILVHNRGALGPDLVQSFGERVNQAPDLSVLLQRSSPRHTPEPFIRRDTARTSRVAPSTAGVEVPRDLPLARREPQAITKPKGGTTPRRVVVLRRPPVIPKREERRDHHVALAKMLRPRRPR